MNQLVTPMDMMRQPLFQTGTGDLVVECVVQMIIDKVKHFRKFMMGNWYKHLGYQSGLGLAKETRW